MTSYEIETASALGKADAGHDTWARILVPLLAAAIVIALGLVLVRVTSQEVVIDSPSSLPAASSYVTP